MSIRALLTLLLAAVGYIVLPLDLVPDVMPGLGQLDDALVMAALVYLFASYLPRHGGVRWGREAPEPEAAASPPPDARGSANGGFDSRFGSNDPYVVLGVERAADADAIKHAYRDLIAQYHPDKVAHLSPEFQALAHNRVVAIQRAYTQVAE